MIKASKSFKKALAHAKKIVNDETKDCRVAIFILRDYQELKELDLDGIAWAMHKEGHVHRNDAKWLVEYIEEEIAT